MISIEETRKVQFRPNGDPYFKQTAGKKSKKVMNVAPKLKDKKDWMERIRRQWEGSGIITYVEKSDIIFAWLGNTAAGWYNIKTKKGSVHKNWDKKE